MKARLISYSQTTSERLLAYLAKHKHWSPFEMVSACLEIETTRDIARQLLRHRSFSFQEFSQRYADPTEDLDFVIREASKMFISGQLKMASLKNKHVLYYQKD